MKSSQMKNYGFMMRVDLALTAKWDMDGLELESELQSR